MSRRRCTVRLSAVPSCSQRASRETSARWFDPQSVLKPKHFFFCFSHYENGFCSLVCRDTELIYSLSTESGCNKCCRAETRGVLRGDGRAQRPTVTLTLILSFITMLCSLFGLRNKLAARNEMNEQGSADLRSIKHVYRTQLDLRDASVAIGSSSTHCRYGFTTPNSSWVNGRNTWRLTTWWHCGAASRRAGEGWQVSALTGWYQTPVGSHGL